MSVQFRDQSIARADDVSGAALDEVRQGLLKLHAKVDSFFVAVQQRHRTRMRCGEGCTGCCHRMPGVFPVEAWIIADHLRGQPPGDTRDFLRSLREHAAVEEVSPCPMLNARGSCRIYSHRPIICRSHGSPIKVPGRPAQNFDVCPLNFSSRAMRNTVATEDILDVERLNEILAVVDGLFQQGYPHVETLPLRMPLASGILHFSRLI